MVQSDIITLGPRFCWRCCFGAIIFGLVAAFLVGYFYQDIQNTKAQQQAMFVRLRQMEENYAEQRDHIRDLDLKMEKILLRLNAIEKELLRLTK